MANFKQNRVLRPKDLDEALKGLQKKFLFKEDDNVVSTLNGDIVSKDTIGRVYSRDWNNPCYKVRGKIEDKEGLYEFDGLSIEECLDALNQIKKRDKVSFLYLECYAPEAKGEEEEDSQKGGEKKQKKTSL